MPKTDLKALLVKELERLPGVTHQVWPERDDGFSSVNWNGKSIAHFHNANEIDIRLGKTLIAEEGLKHNAQSKYHPKRSPKSPHIEVQFHNRRDVQKIVRLMRRVVDK